MVRPTDTCEVEVFNIIYIHIFYLKRPRVRVPILLANFLQCSVCRSGVTALAGKVYDSIVIELENAAGKSTSVTYGLDLTYEERLPER